MISTLTVRNIALIEKTELALGDGLNILSGETGAGKSIVIDSLNFVLGERADKSLIRYGTEEAAVEAVFSDYLTPAVKTYMEDLGIDAEEILVIRRKMTVEGKNECRINGKITTLSTLKGLTELLVDIHGQHEHQSLMKVANHIVLLDGMGGASIFRVKEGDPNLGVIAETLTEHGTRYCMAQNYLPAIKDGDKRVLVVDGEPVPYCLARIPQGGETRGNLAAGGRGEPRPLTESDWKIARQIGPTLKEKGLIFVGLDIIGDRLTEINVTSPTCIREIEAEFPVSITGMLMDAIEARLQQQ